MADTAPDAPATEPSAASQISNLVVRTISEYTGRGPTKAWTIINGHLVTTLLRDTLTKGEHSLVADGHAEMVLDMRKAFQMTMREDLVSGVEKILGRKVEAFLSDNHVDPDLAVETFVMAETDVRE